MCSKGTVKMLRGGGDLQNTFLSTSFREKGDDCQTPSDCLEARSSAWRHDKHHHKQAGLSQNFAAAYAFRGLEKL